MANSIKPNFSAAYSKANEILVKSRVISTFPFSPVDLVKEQSFIKCRTYKKAQKYGINISAFGSESATIFEYLGKQIIFYDDSKSMAHIRYSILHELGHFLNNHDFSTADKEIYGRYEVETNYFCCTTAYAGTNTTRVYQSQCSYYKRVSNATLRSV